MSSGEGTEGEEANLPATRHSNRAEILMTMGDTGQKEKDKEQAGYAWRVWVRSVEEFPSFLQFVWKSGKP